MKIRNGFVSNSSTSSFICLGWDNNLKDDSEFMIEFKNFLKANDVDIYEDAEFNFFEIYNSVDVPDTAISTEDSNGNFFFGYELNEEMSIEELKDKISKVEEKCKDKKHIFSIYQKHFGKPKFKTIVEVNY